MTTNDKATDKNKLKSKLIYAVDDDPINLKLLKSILMREGYERVELIYSGYDLLKEINMQVPDLILLDIMMPGMSGYDALKEIKGTRKYAHIPVIMITAAPQDEDMEPLRKSFELGAQDYLGKPFNAVELEKRVNNALFLEFQRKELEDALRTIRTLEKLLPICSYCKKIRNEDSYWADVEVYISEHTDTMFSHSICPDCYQKHIKPQLDKLHKEDSQ